MLRYQFPIIETLDDVLPAIEGREEFIQADRGDIVIIDYAVSFSDTFPDPLTAPDEATARLWALRRECRGLIFCKHTRKLLSRSWHKFFNAGERDETQFHRIDLTEPHVKLTKLDGSMVRPFIDASAKLHWNSYPTRPLMWGTMLGNTDVAKWCEEMIAKSNVDYDGFAMFNIAYNNTPIFEMCSRRNRIVVDYPSDQLVLTGIRNMRTGEYMPYAEMKAFADEWGIPVVEALTIDSTNIAEYVASVRVRTEGEGDIIRFPDGHMLKVKNDWYCRIHKTKEHLAFEKNVIAMVLNKEIDDVIPDMAPSDRDRLLAFADALHKNIQIQADALRVMVDTWVLTRGNNKKRFATEYMPSLSKDFMQKYSGIMFSIFDGKPAYDLIMERILKNTNSSTQVESVRYLFGDIRWEQF